ncbi:MAG: STAS domain-containing protein [Phycisphaeraceae bacterium]|nr:STAS domain-containing protein [Phycisphaeraceae bacterium]
MFRQILKRLGPLGDATPSTAGAQANLPLAERQATGVGGPARASGGKLFTFDLLGPTAVVTIMERHLTAPAVAELLHDLRDLLAHHPGVHNLVLDLQNVDYLDSACLNMLITLLQAVKAAGGRIAIASAQRSIEVLFKLTRLDKVFPIQRDVLHAIHLVEQAA